jgi:hypothetical protein
MQTPLYTELFPDQCEVVEMPLHTQWIYLIQKNGSSSLRGIAERDNLSVLVDEQLKSLKFVDVYIRNAKDRYVSGVNTYLQHFQRDHPNLDPATAFWFAKHYKFLNSHYLPQFYWLANLSKHIGADTKIRLRNFENIGSVVAWNDTAGVVPPTDQFIRHLFEDDANIELYLFLDQILLELTGKEFTWAELVEYYRSNHAVVIDHVLPKT